MIKRIEKRRVRNLKDQAVIAMNPFSKNPQELLNDLDRKSGAEYVTPEFDAVGFELLKAKMKAAGSSMIVKD